MPYSMKKKGGKFQVTSPTGIKAKGTTKEKAEAQTRLLRAVDHGWKPTGAKSKSKRPHVSTGEKIRKQFYGSK